MPNYPWFELLADLPSSSMGKRMGNGLNEHGEDFLGTDVQQIHIRPKKNANH